MCEIEPTHIDYPDDDVLAVSVQCTSPNIPSCRFATGAGARWDVELERLGSGDEPDAAIRFERREHRNRDGGGDEIAAPNHRSTESVIPPLQGLADQVPHRVDRRDVAICFGIGDPTAVITPIEHYLEEHIDEGVVGPRHR